MTSVNSAPGMQGAIRRMSMSTSHVSAGGSGTSKELSNSTETGSYRRTSVIERVSSSLGNARRRRTPRQSATSAAFSVALGRIAADILVESGR